MSNESRLWAILSHVSFFILPVIVPLILMFVKEDDPFVRHHARQALVFHLMMWIAGAISGFLVILLIGIVLVPLVGIFGLVFTIIAIIRTVDGDYYRYPVSGNWLQ
ncbi:MAG TPA: DUF4870 domain-containing protein [Bacilli bacterium]|nr:DUF4870 domain-containing protein [Bacilli bacterium]